MRAHILRVLLPATVHKFDLATYSSDHKSKEIWSFSSWHDHSDGQKYMMDAKILYRFYDGLRGLHNLDTVRVFLREMQAQVAVIQESDIERLVLGFIRCVLMETTPDLFTPGPEFENLVQAACAELLTRVVRNEPERTSEEHDEWDIVNLIQWRCWIHLTAIFRTSSGSSEEDTMISWECG